MSSNTRPNSQTSASSRSYLSTASTRRFNDTNRMTVVEAAENQPRTCFFNQAHKIHPNRYQYHLVKCRKNYPNKVYETCDFNATHLFDPADKEDHYAECPDVIRDKPGAPNYTSPITKYYAPPVVNKPQDDSGYYASAAVCDDEW